ncbi:ABC transporter substrate-binding protein [Acidipropionibacterium jensenii]|uniref:ABC transporter substrate-binding protein n=1 Tax=Acidipropionibacterium jensenii TaxID=1749 RepID=UPI00214C46F7|nr:ABC transporter substrate-binding protein [Acidipropionibacterium jensenii]
MNKLTRIVPVGLVTLALALAGCTNASQQETGSEGAGAGSSSSATADAGHGNDALLASIQKDPEIAKLLPSKIADKGVITVGSSADYAPAEFADTDGTTIIGYDIDYAKAMGKLMGVDVKASNATFDTLLPSVGSKFDIALSSFTITAEREKQVNMISYFTAGMAKAVLKGNPKNVPADSLCGVTVAVSTGTSEDDDAQKQSKECVAAGKKPATILSYKTLPEATTNVVGGKADISYGDSMIIAYSVARTNGTLEQLGGITQAAPFGVVVAKNDDALAKAIQAATQKLIDDGTMKKILATWGNDGGMITKSEINPALK